LSGAVSAAALVACAGGAWAGGTAENALVIIDPTDRVSMQVGNAYIAARNIPAANVLYLRSAAANYAEFVSGNQAAFLATLGQRGIGDHIDYVVLAPLNTFFVPAPGLIEDPCSPVTRFSISSVYTMAQISSDVVSGVSVGLANGYASTTAGVVAFDANNRYLGGNNSAAGSARRYFIGALLGWTGNLGSSPQQVIDLINRSVQVDGTKPVGSFYYMNNAADPARNVRQPGFAGAISAIQARSGVAAQLNGVLPNNRTNCLGIMTGNATFNLTGSGVVILPGAFCDHLTSYAATFDEGSQTKLTAWLVAGASGSAGTVEEPCNYTIKFPSPLFHPYYFQGLSLGESYLRSMAAVPFQSLLVGDPLTRPFASIPSATITNLPATPVSGTVALNATATSVGTSIILTQELLVDGVLRGTINASSGAFSLDTTALFDGHHDVRVLAKDSSPARNMGRFVGSIVTNNYGKSATVSPVGGTVGNLATPFTFTLAGASTAGSGVVRELRLLSNGRVVAAGVPSGGGSVAVTVFGNNLGAGSPRVVAEALFGDGRVARSAPLVVTVDAAPGSPSVAAPTAYSYSVNLLTPTPHVVALPAAFAGDPASAVYEVVGIPTDATVTGGAALPYRLVTPAANATGSRTLTFRVTVGGQASNLGTVTVNYTVPTACAADFDGSGGLNPDDLSDYITAFFTVPPDPRADFDGSGQVNPDDLSDFITAFFLGC
jgi:uncharacterized protein (TIGR03790 family)